MTRTHVATQLLRLGPLTRAEFLEITGWETKAVRDTLRSMTYAGQLIYLGTTQRGIYAVSSEFLNRSAKQEAP